MLMRSFATSLAFIMAAFALAGCGWTTRHPTKVWHLPDQVEADIAPGDSRQKVHHVLGDSQVDVQNYGIEIYQQSGRDIELYYNPIFPLPFPTPGQHISVVVLISYDQEDVIREIKAELVSQLPEQCIRIGKIELAKSGGTELDTLFGPPITSNKLSETAPSEGACSLVLLMGECPMGDVFLDDHRIVELGDAPIFCPLHTKDGQLNYEPTSDFCDCGLPDKHYFYGTFIRRDVAPGHHSLTIQQRSDGFAATFDCEPNEIIYVELEAHRLSDKFKGGSTQGASTHYWGYGKRFQGRVLTSKKLPKIFDGTRQLRPIIWHRGTWY
jgi:hypothetical protein